MKSKGCDFGSYNGLSYRICFGLTEDGKMDYSKELYEFHKDCKCYDCTKNMNWNRIPPKHLTVTTDDKDKFPIVADLINNFTCSGRSQEDRKYIRV